MRRCLQTVAPTGCTVIFFRASAFVVFVYVDCSLYSENDLHGIVSSNEDFSSSIFCKRHFGFYGNRDRACSLPGAIGIYAYSDTKDGYKIVGVGYGKAGTYSGNVDNFFFNYTSNPLPQEGMIDLEK